MIYSTVYTVLYCTLCSSSVAARGAAGSARRARAVPGVAARARGRSTGGAGVVSGGCTAQVMATQEAAAPDEVALVVGTAMASGVAEDAAGEVAGGVAGGATGGATGGAVADPLQDQVAVFGDPRGRILLREKPQQTRFLQGARGQRRHRAAGNDDTWRFHGWRARGHKTHDQHFHFAPIAHTAKGVPNDGKRSPE
eukprot:COSAG02_NODE_4596_length_5179_cov_108.866535_3_plen_196_part_00